VARRTPLLLSTALGVAALPACEDRPSFRLRWQMAESTDLSQPIPDDLRGEDIVRAYQCSEVGVTAVRLTTFDVDGLIASDDVHPCFGLGFSNPERPVLGPQLPAGDYMLVVRGVQRDLRSWLSPKRAADAGEDYDPDVICLPGADACTSWQLACDCAMFTAVDEQTYGEFDEFVLEAPYRCIDGIDNDDDGLVDAKDPGCSGREATTGDCQDGADNDDDDLVDVLDPGCYSVDEDRDAAIVQFTLTASILDHHPTATCDGAGLASFLVTGTTEAGESVEVATLDCQLRTKVFFTAELAGSGSLAISVTGVGPDGPVTIAVPTDKSVEAGSNAIIDLEVDFATSAFEPPLVEPASFYLNYAQDPDATIVRESCDAGAWGTLAIDALSVRLLDSAGALVPGATASSKSVTIDAALDGTPFACDHSQLTTNELEWGSYRIVADALAADGTVCFTADEGELLAPGASATLVLARVLVDGAPPPSCVDCMTSDDCDGYECVDGMCR
jgi:hypothetical protein